MNYIESFMKDNDIQVNEEFYIFDGAHKLFEYESRFYFDENLQLKEKVEEYLYDNYVPFLLGGLLSGEYRIEKLQPKPKSVFNLEEGDDFWFVTAFGDIAKLSYYSDCANKEIIENGNAFLTEEEAYLEAQRRKCETILLKYGTRDMMSLGDGYIKKFYIMYNNFNKEIMVYSDCFIHRQGTIYFKSRELAQRAIKEVGEDNLKKYIFHVK